jgi:ATP-dependent HslUV protease ATP-binding subunit HslU
MRTTLRSGELEDRKIDVEVPAKSSGDRFGSITFDGSTQGEFMGVPGDLSKLMNSMKTKKTEKKQMYIKDARVALEEAESEKLLEDYDLVKEAITSVEESGIVFIDEIDKLVSGGDYRGADASSEGVQRDLLPIIEGSTVSTKHGNVNTEFILFICSGAFHHAKPSDLLAELQGRLPIRVYVKALTEDDMYKILTEPVSNLIRQQLELMSSEDFTLTFTDEAIREIARVSFEVNKTVENIGARRLHTVIERIVEEISFDAPDKPGEELEIDEHYVRNKVSDLLIASDLKKFIL